MKKYKVTLCYYGPADFGRECKQASIELESDSQVHAEWKASDLLGIRQYYAAWAVVIA